MEKFISLYHQPVHSRDVMEACFFCVEHSLSGISVTPDMLSKARDLLSDDFLLSSCVEFPSHDQGLATKSMQLAPFLMLLIAI